jgi:hypothetical protein
MPDKDIRLLIQALGGQLFEKQSDPTGTVAMLITETVRFRDKLKDETGEVLTVSDTRVALDALEKHLNGDPLPKNLTSEQKTLTQIWVDRLTLFK